MTFQIVRAKDSRVTDMTVAVFTTLASPQIGGTEGTSMFTVQMQKEAAGPHHVMDSEQIWHLLSGAAMCVVDGTTHNLEVGDTIRIAGGVTRQFTAVSEATFLVTGKSEAMAHPEVDPTPIAPPWLA